MFSTSLAERFDHEVNYLTDVELRVNNNAYCERDFFCQDRLTDDFAAKSDKKCIVGSSTPFTYFFILTPKTKIHRKSKTHHNLLKQKIQPQAFCEFWSAINVYC